MCTPIEAVFSELLMATTHIVGVDSRSHFRQHRHMRHSLLISELSGQTLSAPINGTMRDRYCRYDEKVLECELRCCTRIRIAWLDWIGKGEPRGTRHILFAFSHDTA